MPDDGLRPRRQTLTQPLNARFLNFDTLEKTVSSETRPLWIALRICVFRSGIPVIRSSFETNDQGRMTQLAVLSSARIVRADRDVSGGQWHSTMPWP